MRQLIVECTCPQCDIRNSRELALEYYDRHKGEGCYAGRFGYTALIMDAHIFAKHVAGTSPGPETPVGILR